MNIDKKALIGFITEIEASRERAKAETRHQSEILKQAKEKQFDTKAIRKVLQRRAMSAGDRDSLDLAVDTYERAMGSLAAAQEAVNEGRMTGRQAAEHYGVPRGALAVVTGGSKTGFSSHPAHDADGVITETGEADKSGAAAGQPSEPSSPAEQSVNSGPPLGRVSPRSQHGQEEHPGTHPGITQDDAEREGGPGDFIEGCDHPYIPVAPADEAPATPSVGAVAREPATERVAPNNPDLEMPEIPSFLRRPQAQEAGV